MTAPLLENVVCAVCGSGEQAPARIRPPRDEHAIELSLPSERSAWVVCRACGLVYQSPRPGPEAVARLYSGGDYHTTRGGVPEHYIAYSVRRSVRALQWAFQHDGVTRGGRLALDIGCGVGGALVEMRRHGFDVVGVEPDPQLAEVGRQRFGLDIRNGFLEPATFAAGEAFDFAYSCHVWEHLADPLETTRLVARLLAPRQGYFAIVVPTFRAARTLAWSCFTAPHTYMFTHVSLGNVLRAAGCDVVDHVYRSDADSELWLLARARPERSPSAEAAVERESLSSVQRELALVPLRAPLGVPGRLGRHVRTFVADPRDFAGRLKRWASYRLGRLKATLGR